MFGQQEQHSVDDNTFLIAIISNHCGCREFRLCFCINIILLPDKLVLIILLISLKIRSTIHDIRCHVF